MCARELTIDDIIACNHRLLRIIAYSKQLASDDVSFCAAAYGGCVCVGRMRAPGVSIGLPPKQIGDIGPPSGKPDANQTTPKTIMDFINENKAAPWRQVGWGASLTPRTIKGYTGENAKGDPTDVNKASLSNKVVWGEGCDDTMHMDCKGLIRHAVEKISGVPVVGVSHTTARSSPLNKWNQPTARLVRDGEAMLPADILCYGSDEIVVGDEKKGGIHHIAFADQYCGQYAIGRAYMVVQAEGAVHGLNYGKPPRSDHFKCLRLSPSTLLNQNIKGPYPNTSLDALAARKNSQG
jgi:hypothetical protein